MKKKLASLLSLFRKSDDYKGPFLEHSNQGAPFPHILLIVGVIFSAIIVVSHFFSFKDHLRQAETRLQKHQSLLYFTERFSTLEESLTVVAMAAMKSRDRELLAQYLVQKEKVDDLIDEFLRIFEGDSEAIIIIKELDRTNQELIDIEYKYFSSGNGNFTNSLQYKSAKERIQKGIRALNKRIVSTSPSAKDSLSLLNQDFKQRNAVVIFSLIVFWATIGAWALWIYDDQKNAKIINSQQRSLLEALIQAMPSGVIATNKNNEVILWNVAATRAFPEGPDFFFENLASMINEKSCEVSFREEIYDCQKRTLKDVDTSQNIGEMTLFENVTKKHKIQYELDLERQKKVHLSKMASLGEVAGNLAHEINTPLATLRLSIDGIERAFAKSDKEVGQTLLKCINQSVTRMSSIIEAFRRYTRIDSSSQKTDISSFKSIVNDVLEICEPDLRSRGIKYEVIYKEDDILLDCCAGSISQVVINLITNARDAVKALKESWIRIELEQISETVVLRVIDSGHGIAIEHQDKIFNPFFTTKPRGEGSGVGLGIVKDIVSAHYGNVQYCLKDGHTCFEVTFPSLSLSIAS